MSGPHPSHKTRYSDASTFDTICEVCGAHDQVPGGWGELANPCPGPDPDFNPEEKVNEPKLCTEKGCTDFQSNGSSLCPEHYQRWLGMRIGTIRKEETQTYISANQQSPEMAPHYARAADAEGKQHWDRMWEKYREAWFVGNITKYVERYKDKDGLKDLKKAMHYLTKLIELETAEIKTQQEKEYYDSQRVPEVGGKN